MMELRISIITEDDMLTQPLTAYDRHGRLEILSNTGSLEEGIQKVRDQKPHAVILVFAPSSIQKCVYVLTEFHSVMPKPYFVLATDFSVEDLYYPARLQGIDYIVSAGSKTEAVRRALGFLNDFAVEIIQNIA